MRIAYELHLTEEAVLNMSVGEFVRWGAFLDLTGPKQRS